ncbi:MAG TPA: bile acid:sodium symporter family protein [Sphingomonas sp.]
MRRIKIDTFTLLLVATVAFASILPCRGIGARLFGGLTQMAIVLLFFMHGAKLSREAVVRGLSAWRLHLLVLASTFILFPLLGLALAAMPIVDGPIGRGLIFLSILPSTVQSSIALTAIAGGNVAAAVCSASLSNIVGVVLTPLLASLTLSSAVGGQGIAFGSAVGDIALTLLLPFVLGHLSRRWTADLVDRHRAFLMRLDRGSILLVVYTAFSAAVMRGLWHQISAADLVAILLCDAVLLALVLVMTSLAARIGGFARADEIVLVFCGSKKSLASGVPMAAALFPVAQVGPMLLPLMIFHQLQLIVCAMLAQRHAARGAVLAAA